MQTISIKSMKLVNFKGIRDLSVDFSKNTDIYADNGVGKSTIMDAFLWLLFGKDAADRKDYGIKTYDENNVVIPKIDHEVSATIEVDGLKVNPKRIYREKWSTTKGSTVAEFKGNETVFFWNDVPLSASEYASKVSSLVDEKLFKLLTNPMYFNESMKWQDRRAVLMDVAGLSLSDKVYALLDADKQAFVQSVLNQGKSLEEYKAELAARRKRLKDEIAFIPSRIDEANRSLPEPKDYDAIRVELEQVQAELAKVEKLLEDAFSAQRERQQAALQLDNEIFGIKSEINRKRNEYTMSATSDADRLKAEIDRLQANVRSAESQAQSLDNSIGIKNDTYNGLVAKKAQLLDEYNKVLVEQVVVEKKPVTDTCGTCGQHLPEDMLHDAEELAQKAYDNAVAQANAAKEQRLSSIKSRGTSVKEEMDRVLAEIESLASRSTSLIAEATTTKVKIAELQQQLDSQTASNLPLFEQTDTYITLSEKLAKMEEQAANQPSLEDNSSEHRTAKAELQQKASELSAQLQDEGQREKILARIEELKASEKSLAQQIADVDGEESRIKEVEHAKINIMESRVNGLFSIVKFKLFNELINGGIEETCEAMINGVPFGSLNNAGRINAGLDIINALSAHYGSNAPIFVDNAEAVVRLLPTNSQLIRLIVSGDDKVLRIVNN